jgi:hypothetical protein
MVSFHFSKYLIIGQFSNANTLIRIMVSIALGVPLSIYLWRRGDTKKPNNDAVGEHRGANQEYTQNAEGNQSIGRQNSDTNSSAHDEVR